MESVKKTECLLTLEEGSLFSGWGAEVISQIAEETRCTIKYIRIGGMPFPIPSIKSLENVILPNEERIMSEIKEKYYAQ